MVDPEPMSGLRVFPLGGLGEVGMNCLALEQDGQVMLVDCGVTFDARGLGIDVVFPDFSALEAYRDRIAGVLRNTLWWMRETKKRVAPQPPLSRRQMVRTARVPTCFNTNRARSGISSPGRTGMKRRRILSDWKVKHLLKAQSLTCHVGGCVSHVRTVPEPLFLSINSLPLNASSKKSRPLPPRLNGSTFSSWR